MQSLKTRRRHAARQALGKLDVVSALTGVAFAGGALAAAFHVQPLLGVLIAIAAPAYLGACAVFLGDLGFAHETHSTRNLAPVGRVVVTRHNPELRPAIVCDGNPPQRPGRAASTAL